MCRVPFPCVALIRWGVELGGGGGRVWETCLTSSGIPLFSPAAMVVHRESPALCSDNSVVKQIQGWVKTIKAVTRVPVCKRRLLAEDHTQHPSGTAEWFTL